MLIYFAVTNFKSFRDKVEFSMIPTVDDNKTKDHINRYDNISLLRIAAIYGNNAAGKTNLLEAIQALRKIVIGQMRRNEEIIVPFKLEPSCLSKPTEFEIEYLNGDNRYYFELSILKGEIQYERLSFILSDGTEKTIYERTLDNGKTSINFLQKANTDKEKMRLELFSEELDNRKCETFLRFAIKRDYLPEFGAAYGWFANKLEVVYSNAHYFGEIPFFADKHMKEKANLLLSLLDLGIEDIQLKQIPLEDLISDASLLVDIKHKVEENVVPVLVNRGKYEYHIFKDDGNRFWAGRLVTIHKNGVEFELYEESLGTRMVLELIPGMVGAIIARKVYLFDEFELGKHPEMTKLLVLSFVLAGENGNGQMIFTTHECNLLDLDILRKDEIWFAEKDNSGNSHIYSLSDFEPTEIINDDLKKDYLNGRYTKIPFFADPNKLKWYDYKAID